MVENKLTETSKFKIALIGGAGKMGQWVCRFAIEEGLHVVVSDKDPDKLKTLPKSEYIEIANDNKTAISQAKIVAIAVPMGVFEETVKEIAPYIRPGSVVMDISSMKARPVAVMHRYIKNSVIVGAHPLFGPGAKSLRGQNVILTPTNEKETAIARDIARHFENCGAKVTLMSPEAHDKMMAVVQGLSHFTAIAAADALSGLGELKEMKNAATTTFNIFVDYLESVIGDDPELYAAIQMEHPEMPEIYEKLAQSIEKFGGYVKAQDTKSFVKRMKELKKFLGK